ncbi:hypothetical protein [Kribbella sp. NPDC049227]|uniref:hypothetical protein n=1 Tax=Kribbella sp. NPDC049227 TaxID=3364113 RepID=UPI003715CB54
MTVDEDGVWLTDSGGRFGYPWSELTGAGISVFLLPPDDEREAESEPPNLATLSPEDTVSIALVGESPSA